MASPPRDSISTWRQLAPYAPAVQSVRMSRPATNRPHRSSIKSRAIPADNPRQRAAREARIWTQANEIHFPKFISADVLPTAAALHSLVHKAGYQDVTLDFSHAEFISPDFMVPLVCLARDYRFDKINFDFRMPRLPKTSNLIMNSNWAHLISPEHYQDRSISNRRHMSAVQFFSPEEHFAAVDKSLNGILETAAGLNRNMLKALEWSLNEVSDNVLNHAESRIGGVLQVITFPQRHRVEFYVCDAGVTIPTSLRSGRPEIGTDEEAVGLAITEGMTRNTETNQGNGLYGTFKCCEVSGGQFHILSGYTSLSFANGQLKTNHNTVPFKGTFVKVAINYNYDRLLEKALIFKGKPHDPGYDFIERIYQDETEETIFKVREQLTSFGSREAGRQGRNKLTNLMENGTQSVVCDFSDISLISSSFADEVFGKLFVELGPVKFNQLCRLKNVDSTVRSLIDRAILMRVRQAA